MKTKSIKENLTQMLINLRIYLAAKSVGFIWYFLWFSIFLIVLISLLVIASLLYGIVTWPLIVGNLLEFINQYNESSWFLACGVIVIAGFGALMYFLHKHFQFIYFLIEVIGAAVLALVTLSKTADSQLAFATAFIASVFFFFRSISSFAKLFEGSPSDLSPEFTFTSPVSHAEAFKVGFTEILKKEKELLAAVEQSKNKDLVTPEDIPIEMLSVTVVDQEVVINNETEFEYKIKLRYRPYKKFWFASRQEALADAEERRNRIANFKKLREKAKESI